MIGLLFVDFVEEVKEDNIDLLLELSQRQDNTLTGFMLKTDKSFQEVT